VIARPMPIRNRDSCTHSPALVFIESFRSMVLASQTRNNPNNNLRSSSSSWGC